jgi:triphosphatase
MPVSHPRDEMLRERLNRFTRMLPGVGKGDPQSVHRMRVASRRLRELLPVLQLDSSVTAEVGRRLRKVTERLGPARELDVQLILLDELQQSGRYDQEALALVASAVSQERAAARKRLQAKLPVAELRRIASKLDKLADELAERPIPGGIRASTRASRWAVGARIGRRGAALKTAIEDAGGVYLADRLHAVRIAVKKFRYAVELDRDVSRDKKLTPHLRTLKRSQEVLGRLHDRHVLIERMRQLQASSAPTNLVLWRRLDSLLRALEEECRRLHGRYVRESEALLAVCDRVPGRTPAAPSRRVG